MPENKIDIQKEMEDRLHRLPKVVQDAILSADVEKRLRTLADSHKLHLDQWQILENEVMFTLLGMQRVEDLEKNITSEVGLDAATAHALAGSISEVVFDPIRQELERQLEHPEEQAKEMTGVETSRAEALQTNAEEATVAPSAPAVAAPSPITQSVVPATPPAPLTDIKVTRPSESSAYKPGEPSITRAAVHDDPYREPPV